ncbi:acyl-CoA dehydrogenase family protein [Dactylosporangium sucinum]|uniref:Acyl-CoA dehydrogenase FadE n=1 Tax=Dactylosporangium sucinum TaxID=1424081 RepID=A0A917X677_9ACTN|nr:acyl-CoA dehydrogenase family protein [Dactylosporangium sucinum]GGM75314.1 putative acyl-CoA dehydrogenase FadE [Dactylosporangium sucinum]
MNFSESSEHLALRGAVSEIGAKYGHDYFARCAAEGRFTHELWSTIFDNGFGGVNLPEEFGGGGGGIQEMAIVIEELAAQGCPLLFLIVAGMCGPIIDEFGSAAQQERWLPGLAAGRTKMAFAITESGAGSNAPNLATTATRAGDGWVIKGAKQYITGMDVADAVLVVTRTGTDPRGRGLLTLFVVDTDTPGLEFRPIPMEIKAPDRQFAVFFDDVVVPTDRLVGGVADQGLRQIFSGLNPERINVAAQATGLGRYFLDKAVAYAKDRAVWGVPIGSHQGVAHPLAEVKIELELARLMTARAAWQFDNGEAGVGEAAAVAKLAAADAVLHAFDQTVQVHGGNAFATEYGIGDLWGLTRLMRSAPVSREMVLNYVAQHSLGLPRSY